MRWQRWLKIIGGFTVAAATFQSNTCMVDLPNSIFVRPPPVVVDDDDDDGTCVFADCD